MFPRGCGHPVPAEAWRHRSSGRHRRIISWAGSHVPEHFEVHGLRSKREGRPVRLGEGTMHSRAVHIGTAPIPDARSDNRYYVNYQNIRFHSFRFWDPFRL
jgi:hypothetical protein